jgi:hypothetical protein
MYRGDRTGFRHYTKRGRVMDEQRGTSEGLVGSAALAVTRKREKERAEERETLAARNTYLAHDARELAKREALEAFSDWLDWLADQRAGTISPRVWQHLGGLGDELRVKTRHHYSVAGLWRRASEQFLEARQAACAARAAFATTPQQEG